MKTLLSLQIILLLLFFSSCSDVKQTERLFSHFLNRHVERIKPVNKEYNEALWNTYSGQSSFSDLMARLKQTDSLYRAAGEPIEYYQSLLNNVYDNSSDLEMLIKIKQLGLLEDPMLKRQFAKVFRQYINIQNNWSESDSQKTKLFEQFFALKRSESAFWDSIKTVNSENPRREWIAQFADLTEDYRQMIKAMNNDAEKLGYLNYYQILMDFNDVDYDKLDEFTDLIETETREDYKLLLSLSQDEITKSMGIEKADIQPKHYSYMVGKMVLPENWRVKWSEEKALSIINQFMAYGNYNLVNVLDESDLWFEKGKVKQSFFSCIDIEKKDFRVYANVEPDPYGVYTLLHEFGHALHFQQVREDVPYLLKEPQSIATEAVAIYFNDKLYHSPALRKLMELPEPNSPFYDHFKDPTRLVFLRKLIRNIQFEKQIFENPDQDYNELWWALTEKYMFYGAQNKDRLPEWISNQHIVNATGIHVHYLYAFAISAQLEAYFPDDVIGPLNGFMEAGNSMVWEELLEKVTGEPLNLSYLFNSYRKEERMGVPITFETKHESKLSVMEEKHVNDLALIDYRNLAI